MTAQDQLFLRKHSQIEKRYARLFNTVLSKQYRELAKLFIENKPLEQVDTMPLQRLYTRMYLDVMKIEGYATWMEYVFPLTDETVLKKDITDSVAEALSPDNPKEMQSFWQSLMNNYLNIYILKRVSEVVGTTIKRVRELIEKQRELSLDNQSIAKLIRKEAINQELRANTIARTETTNAISKSQVLALESSKIGWEKSWKHIRDDRTRDAHRVQDPDLWIPIRDNFNIGGYQMAYPGDATQGAPIGQFINCRCYMKYRKAKVLEGRVGFRPGRITEQYIQESN